MSQTQSPGPRTPYWDAEEAVYMYMQVTWEKKAEELWAGHQQWLLEPYKIIYLNFPSKGIRCS